MYRSAGLCPGRHWRAFASSSNARRELDASAFGVTLAEMSAQGATIDDHYKSLGVPMLLGSLLVTFLAFPTATLRPHVTAREGGLGGAVPWFEPSV
jgi:hypothetical protein